MDVLSDLKAKADANGDGKLSKEDLEGLSNVLPTDQLEQLKAKADANGDGKIDFEDVKKIDFSNVVDDAKDALDGARENLGGMFK